MAMVLASLTSGFLHQCLLLNLHSIMWSLSTRNRFLFHGLIDESLVPCLLLSEDVNASY